MFAGIIAVTLVVVAGSWLVWVLAADRRRQVEMDEIRAEVRRDMKAGRL